MELPIACFEMSGFQNITLAAFEWLTPEIIELLGIALNCFKLKENLGERICVPWKCKSYTKSLNKLLEIAIKHE